MKNILKLNYKPYLDQSAIELSSVMTNTDFWDPVGKRPTLEEFVRENKVNYAKYLFIKDNPKHVIIKQYIFWISGLFFSSLTFLTLQTFLGFSFLTFFFSFIVFAIIVGTYSTKMSNLTKKIIKLNIAVENRYSYIPRTNKEFLESYAAAFPELFSRGFSRRKIEDVFWGQEEINGKKIDFVSGIFQYTEQKTDNNTQHYTKHFFILRFTKKLPVRFSLYPKLKGITVMSGYTKGNVKTESVEFNKKFDISYKNVNSEQEVNIMASLTPKVQEELISLSKSTWYPMCIVTPDALLIAGDGYILNYLHTNFGKGTQLHTNDIQLFQKKIKTIASISNEITKYW
ncbi:MAG: hypothetical protein ACMXYA_01800 [Candidatus Woesearchaeota archaeon]